MTSSGDDTLQRQGPEGTVGAAVTTLLGEIETEKRWRDQLSEPTSEFSDTVRAKLSAWGRALAILDARGHHGQAERVAAAIVKLRDHWGPELLPVEDLRSFPRDMFRVGALDVLVVQFFEPVPYSPGNDRILKLYQFLVSEQGRTVADYCLEYSQLSGDSYVLGRMDPKAHTQIQPYGNRPPSYAALRKRVIRDLQGSRHRRGPSLQKSP